LQSFLPKQLDEFAHKRLKGTQGRAGDARIRVSDGRYDGAQNRVNTELREGEARSLLESIREGKEAQQREKKGVGTIVERCRNTESDECLVLRNSWCAAFSTGYRFFHMILDLDNLS
jgi:hypothetical protein